MERLLTFLAILFMSVLGESARAATWYVDDSARGKADGTSWTNAYVDLQHGLWAASSGDRIWVAAGIYFPGGTARDTFQLKTGVEVIGGFGAVPGTERSFKARDFESFISVLSGDIGRDDGSDPAGILKDAAGIVGQNSNHVVTGSGTDPTAVLDGFIITGGQASSGVSAGEGGGMLNREGSPTLLNLKFSGNTAEGDGAGMFNSSFSNPTLINVFFAGNSAGRFGGGMYNFVSAPSLVNVAFSGNQAREKGGAISNLGSSPSITHVTFFGNSAGEGGGMCNEGTSTPTIHNSILWGNTSKIRGDQVLNLDSESIPGISHSLVEGSVASGGGWDKDIVEDLGSNIDSNPLFVDADGADDIAGTLDDNLGPRIGSPARDKGDNQQLPPDRQDLNGDKDIAETIPFDIKGNPRIFSKIVDLGAFEGQGPSLRIECRRRKHPLRPLHQHLLGPWCRLQHPLL